MIKKKLKSNKGSATTIIGVFMVVLLLLVGIFMVDLSRLVMMKNSYTLIAQNAVLEGVKHQDAYGYLKQSSANAVVESYMKARKNPQIANNKAICDRAGNYPVIHLKFETERGFGEQPGSMTMTSHYGLKFINHLMLQSNFHKNKYKALSVEIEDVSDGFLGGIIGQGCHPITVRAGSINSTLYDEDN